MAEANASQAAEKMLLDALDAIVNGDMQPWVDMFTEDGEMEFPFAPPGYPPHVSGKAAIAEYLKDYPETIDLERFENRGIYHAGNTMIAEFSAYGVAVATGNPYAMKYIGVIQLENGKIKHYRDYWDPLVGLQALGGLEELLNFGKGGAKK